MSWYADLDAMSSDDAYLQRNLSDLISRLCPEAQRMLVNIHVYPSKQCTYTVDKRRIFVCPRNESTGALLSDCALQHVILHELAHVLNRHSIGHDAAFQATMYDLESCLKQADTHNNTNGKQPCPLEVPTDYNSLCRKL